MARNKAALWGIVGVVMFAAGGVVVAVSCSGDPDLDQLSGEANRFASAAGVEVSGQQVKRSSPRNLGDSASEYVELTASGTGTAEELVADFERAAESIGANVVDVEEGADRIYVRASTSDAQLVAEVKTTTAPITVRITSSNPD